MQFNTHCLICLPLICGTAARPGFLIDSIRERDERLAAAARHHTAVAAELDRSVRQYQAAVAQKNLLESRLEKLLATRQNVELLREMWRVLAPSGRMIVVLPNRRGPWARADTTPFGYGRPYSRPQVTQILRETWFTPSAWSEALHMPPISYGWFLRSAIAWERFGSAIASPFAGVHIVEATKQVYRPIAARRERRKLIPTMEPVLVPSASPREKS